MERNRGAWHSHRIWGRRGWSFLEDIAVARLVAVRMLLLCDKYPQTATRGILCEYKFALRKDAQPHDEASHCILGVVHVSVRHRCFIDRVQTGRTRDMSDDVTVKEPVSGSSGNTVHRHCRSVWNPLVDRFPVARRSVNRVTIRVPATVHIEVETVQVHWVRGGTGVDDAPANGVTKIVRESFGVRP